MKEGETKPINQTIALSWQGRQITAPEKVARGSSKKRRREGMSKAKAIYNFKLARV